MILRDLDELERDGPRDAPAVRRWIQATIDKYDEAPRRLAWYVDSSRPEVGAEQPQNVPPHLPLIPFR